jgi:ferric-dicitrate binding protein FerR (iron transport regulator)
MSATRQMCVGLVIFLVYAGASGQTPAPSTLPVGSVTIAELKGEVDVHSPQGQPLTASRGLTLEAESKIDTGKGSVLLDLQDGSQVLVKSNSHVVLKSPTGGKGYWLELLLGKINAKVQKRLGNAPSFRMGTPTAVITVRGTRFGVDVDKKQKTRVEVYEGLVEVAGFFHGAPVMVRPGYTTGVESNHDPEQPHGTDNRERENENRWSPGVAPGGRGEDDPNRDRDRERQGTHTPPPPTSPDHDHEPE